MRGQDVNCVTVGRRNLRADLLIACNPLPPPPRIDSFAAASPLGDFLAELNPVNRLRDLRVSFELMVHDFGDCEASDTRVFYDPPPDAGALFGTYRFGRARELCLAVEREPRFRETVQRSVEAYRKLAAPRAPERAVGGLSAEPPSWA